MNENDIVMVDINGQYEFAKVHYLRDDSKYIAITTRSGRTMGGPFDAAKGEMKGDGAVYSMHKANGAEPGYASAVEYFEDQ